MENVEIHKSKNGELVPSINGFYFHSLFNANKEAENFVENHLHTLKQKSNILVLGLGYGYHVAQIIYHLKQFHESYKVVVIEPSILMKESCKESNSEVFKSSLVFSGDVKSIYNDRIFNQFLLTKPGVIVHKASFDYHYSYFKDFLSYEAQQTFSDYKKNLPIDWANHFSQVNDNETWNIFIENIKRKKKVDRLDYLLLGCDQLSQS